MTHGQMKDVSSNPFDCETGDTVGGLIDCDILPANDADADLRKGLENCLFGGEAHGIGRERIELGTAKFDFVAGEDAVEKGIAVLLMSQFDAVNVDYIDADAGDSAGEIKRHGEHIKRLWQAGKG